MDIALAIFVAIIGWISGVVSDFFGWLDKPASNGIVFLTLIALYWRTGEIQKIALQRFTDLKATLDIVRGVRP